MSVVLADKVVKVKEERKAGRKTEVNTQSQMSTYIYIYIYIYASMCMRVQKYILKKKDVFSFRSCRLNLHPLVANYFLFPFRLLFLSASATQLLPTPIPNDDSTHMRDVGEMKQ
ncbi:hypothetical protein, unlikely [Trypanosoma brucei gambiense DAL972]|uniref:Uncharacterized protein n=1 Tax=Trypanosoma brucei gambiense (strain MHOM/CI/86/DAL972) TaxID=679716 RepID=C9ZNS1_TRYB9|nr:hypothetical protein, unlikely [Trypanosoma brucei gambiense DAL972]CBH11049.1 hypothetical protein, unlikely [Trypanosoma brucei gambiense DAL972]|eukprot:XP_011773336.1 hypothetical protein, unlikely [Trypanosoma brucei gambiense DAL972]